MIETTGHGSVGLCGRCGTKYELIAQLHDSLARVQAENVRLRAAIKTELRDGYCFNRMDEARRALHNIAALVGHKPPRD